jgi:hypothetical protein
VITGAEHDQSDIFTCSKGINIQFLKDIESPFKDLFLEIRSYLLKYHGVEEEKKSRVTNYHYNNSTMCHVRTSEEGVEIGFIKGALIPDKYFQLKGTGKNVRIMSLDLFNIDILDYYVGAAVSLNQ